MVLTAAATRIDLSKLKTPSKTMTGGWQDEAWAFFDSVPEVSFATTFTGSAMAKLRLYAATYPVDGDPDAKPIPATEDPSIPTAMAAEATRLVNRLASLSGGQPELLRELNINWEVAGECYLIGWAERPLPGGGEDPAPEWWEICSKDEVTIRDGKRPDGTMGASMFVKSTPDMPVDQQRQVIDREDTAVRLWQRHPRWSGLAWSHIKACLTELRILQVLSGQVMAESMSRHNAGVVFVDSSVDMDVKPVNDPTGADGDEQPEPTFAEKLAAGLVAPITDPSDPASVAPLVAKITTQMGQSIKDMVVHIPLSRESKDTEANIAARLVRLGHGLNLPPEVIEGHMQTTFANAEAIDQDTFDDYLEPRATLMVQGLTFAAFQPDLLLAFPDSGDLVRRIFIWYDPSDLISDDTPAEAANDGWDRGVISDDAWRQARGFNESDAPDDAQRAARAEWLRGPAQPGPQMAPGGPEPAGTPPPALPAARNGNGRRSGPQSGYVLAAVRTRQTVGAQLVGIDRGLRERLLVLADTQMTQTLERAGNRALNRLSRTSKEAHRRAAPLYRVANIGPHGLTAAGVGPDDLLEGAFDGMREQFMAWGGTAQRDALEAVSRAVSGLTLTQRDMILARQARDLDQAWDWLHSTLTVLARARLFDPTPTAPPLGEHDSSLTVPAGVVRSAMAQAGGATGLQIDEGRGVWLPLNQGGNRPAGGIGTGELIGDTLVSNGARLDGYRWVYGPAHRSRPFDPHVELDGVEFANFDDDVLANRDSFPEYGFYMPGDHPGCICDYEPIVLAAP